MDQQSALDPAPAFTGESGGNVAGSVHQRDRRRDKPLLSCVFCRRRKVRCDRRLPCNTCVAKGIELSCSYPAGPQRKATTSVGERIHELEALVRSLLNQQQTQQTSTVPPGGSVTESPAYSFRGEDIPKESPHNVSLSGLTTLDSTDDDEMPTPSDHGTLHGASYVGSVHWAAVLDSIAELKDHYGKEEEARILTNSNCAPSYGPGPRLLYEPVQATKGDILATIPARPVVDRMVARYFNTQGVAPAVLHSSKFLREYENFWQDTSTASFAWIGLLFSIMCLSTHIQQLTENPADSDTPMRVHMFRDRTVHCLVLSKFTKGGDHVLETMINHCTTEVFLCKDADVGLWILLGIVVQLALSMGYHRDASNFPNISPFAGEMRRRVWASIMQIDLRLSSQMGLPRLLKAQQCDTAEPRNILDSDFDETTTELPPSRPETEVTPVLYGLAKHRIDNISGLISDLVADTKEHPYSEIMELERKLHEAEASLPLAFRWQPLSQSLVVPPEIVLHRIWLQLAVQRLVIWLHRKYLAPSPAKLRHQYSQDACLQAAIQILEFQQLIDEETQPHGLLHPVRWMLSSLIHSIFLLGMSVLCYHLQLAKTMPDMQLGKDSGAKIYSLLRRTYPMWLRSSTVSHDAQKAVEYMNLLPGLSGKQEGHSSGQDGLSQLDLSRDANVPFDKMTWDAYQDCITNFPGAFGTDFMATDASGSFTAGGGSMTDPLFASMAELDGWIAAEIGLNDEI